MKRTESCLIVLSLMVLGCGPKVPLPDADTEGETDSNSVSDGPDDGQDGGQTDTRGGPDDGPVATAEEGPGEGPAPTSVGPSDDSIGSFSASSLSESGVFDDDDGPIVLDVGTPGLPDGSSCNDDRECLSGHCFVLGALGGYCGACSSDADCPDGGCTPPNPLSEPPEPSFCNSGGLGEACGTDQACGAELVCMEVLDVPGLFTLSGCSECDASNDCAGNQRCDPSLDFATQTGFWECVPLGSQPLGAICDPNGNGQVCASEHCAIASLMGLAELGVCSECRIDRDCPGGGPCTSPEFGMDGVTPGTCE